MTDEHVIEKLLKMRNLFDDENGDMYAALTLAIGAINYSQNVKQEINDAFVDGYRSRCDELWTPVTDQILPDSDGYYLVTVQNDCGTRREQVSSFVRFNEGTCYSWGIEMTPAYKVLAWMPLPEMWEG